MLLGALSALAQPYPKGEIMAMGYLCFRDKSANEECFRKLAEAGIDMITLDMDQSSAMRQMDLAAQFGIRINAVVMGYAASYSQDPEHYTGLDSLVSAIKGHPALFCYHIYDEPGLNLIPRLNVAKRHIEELDPEHPVYINLNPVGSVNALGTDYYPDYINTLARECDLKLLSYELVLVPGNSLCLRPQPWHSVLGVCSHQLDRPRVPARRARPTDPGEYPPAGQYQPGLWGPGDTVFHHTRFQRLVAGSVHGRQCVDRGL